MTPMSDARTPAEIARGLSAAQRRALLWLREDGGWKGNAGVRSGRALSLLVDACDGELAEREWDTTWQSHNYRALPLGLLARIWIVAYPAGEQHEDGCCANGRTPPADLLANASRARLEIIFPKREGELPAAVGACPWAAEPDIRRMAYGVPLRVDRIKSLGNAVVPQIPEMIGRAIMRATQDTPANG